MLIDIRRQVTEFRVQAEAAVEANDVVGHMASGLGTIGIVVRPDAPVVGIPKEALPDNFSAVGLARRMLACK